MSRTTGSISRRISASTALNGSGGSGVPTTGGAASFEVGGSAGGGGSPAVGGPERSRRRGTRAAHGEKQEVRRRMNGAPARGNERPAAMPRSRENWRAWSTGEWIAAQQQFEFDPSALSASPPRMLGHIAHGPYRSNAAMRVVVRIKRTASGVPLRVLPEICGPAHLSRTLEFWSVRFTRGRGRP